MSEREREGVSPDAVSMHPHSARLAPAGELAARVAHEVSAPLQFLAVSLEYLRRELRRELPGHQGAECRALLDDALEGVRLIRNVTTDLLPFARLAPADMEPVDVNEVVKHAVRVARNQIRHRARLTCELGEMPRVRGNPQQLIQLFTTLLLHAAQEIPEEGYADDNCLTVSTSACDARVLVCISQTRAQPTELPSDAAVTRPDGSSDGLVSLCDHILKFHRARLEVASSAEETALVVELPGLPSLAPVEVLRAVRSTPPSVRRPRILVIDDDELVLKAYRRVLADYELVIAHDGDEALRLVRADPHFDVILSDFAMPRMNGQQFYAELATLAPGLCARVVFCSGSPIPREAAEQFRRSSVRVLVKPIAIDDLRRVVADAAAAAE
jgi:two-component system NtrC family sensor kinase